MVLISITKNLKKMKTSDFTTTLLVDKAPGETFEVINDVRGWWSEDFEGSTSRLNDIFTVRFGEVFITSKVVEFIPGTKIVWQVTDCNKPWLKNTKEWNGTKMCWEISLHDNKTQIRFTHIGLAPEIECFEVCSNAWGEYLRQSLLPLIATGKGKPTPKKAKTGV